MDFLNFWIFLSSYVLYWIIFFERFPLLEIEHESCPWVHPGYATEQLGTDFKKEKSMRRFHGTNT